jgi:SAM-dependent methyltransferase
VLNAAIRWNRSWAERLRARFPAAFSSPPYLQELLARIHADIDARRPQSVLEIGGIDRPLLGKGRGYAYDGLDIESREGCYLAYDDFLVQSVEERIPRQYDMIVSITLLEHVRDNTASVRSMFEALKPGGVTHHYIPSKWHPYSICLRIVGPEWQKRLIPRLRPGTEGFTGYPAFFDHCSVQAMTALFERSGFIDIDVKPYYRANDYFAWFLPAYVVVSALENWWSAWRMTLFASGFVISAKKPARRLPPAGQEAR